MSNINKQIVCISSHYWKDSWFRKQHFMSRFHMNGFKIAYVEPSFSMVRQLDISKKEYANKNMINSIIEKVDKKLFVIKPPRYIPFWTKPYLSIINSLYISLHIKSALKKIGFNNYILWIYRPEFVSTLRMFNYHKLVFDIVDDLAAYHYNNKIKYKYLNKCSINLAKKSDLVIVTASTLLEKFKKFSSKIYLVSNGYDPMLFNEEKIYTEESDLKNVNAPIIGFIGTIFSFLDFELLRYIFQLNKDKTFVFIGDCKYDVQNSWLSIIKNYKNVIWLGKKNKEDIPKYIDKFDVCINPFKVDHVSRSVSPLKVFEYLAMKKPVVSVRMESLEQEIIAPFIYFASSFQDFNNKIKLALDEKDEFSKKIRYEKVKEYSWDYLFKKTFEAVMDL